MKDKVLKLDWLGFTFKADVSRGETPLAQFMEMFPEFKSEYFVVPEFRLSRRYSNCMMYCDIIVSYNTFEGDLTPSEYNKMFSMGVNVQVPSHSLDLLFEMFEIDKNDDFAVFNLFTFLRKRHCKFSRIDMAYDDFNKTFRPSYYARKWLDGLIQTPVHNSNVMFWGSDETGGTMYFGSLKKRNKLLRIYDKFIESEGEIDSVRYEFEYHSIIAENFAELVLNEYKDGVPFIDVLFAIVKIKDKNSVENCGRIQDAKMDSEWIDSVNSQFNAIMPIRIPSVRISYESSLTHYLEYQALPSIAGFALVYGTHALLDIIRQALKQDRINSKYKNYYYKLKACDDLFEDSSYIDNPFL